jgi:hypothetical protein
LTQAHSGVASRLASFKFPDAFCPTPHAVAMALSQADGLAAQSARHCNPVAVSWLKRVHNFRSCKHGAEVEVSCTPHVSCSVSET